LSGLLVRRRHFFLDLILLIRKVLFGIFDTARTGWKTEILWTSADIWRMTAAEQLFILGRCTQYRVRFKVVDPGITPVTKDDVGGDPTPFVVLTSREFASMARNSIPRWGATYRFRNALRQAIPWLREVWKYGFRWNRVPDNRRPTAVLAPFPVSVLVTIISK
jgi:hypothetical protein